MAVEYNYLIDKMHKRRTACSYCPVTSKWGSVANYSEFDPTDGTYRAYGDATAWEDLRVPVTSTTRLGSKDPGFERFRRDTTGTSQGVFVYGFDSVQEEELYFAVQIPHNYTFGTDLHAHVHWGVSTVPPGGTKVRWGLEYTIANIGDVMPVTSTIYTVATDPVTQYKHCINGFSTPIPGVGIDDVSTMLLCRIFRDVANDNFAADAALFEIDFHYQVDSFGSSQEFIK